MPLGALIRKPSAHGSWALRQRIRAPDDQQRSQITLSLSSGHLDFTPPLLNSNTECRFPPCLDPESE